MGGPPALGLFLTLLTLCIMAGTPDVWVQVHREASAFSLRCGFLGSGSISLATVSCGGPEGAGGTVLAVLHPESGVWNWASDCQARWESRTCVSLTLEQCAGGSLHPNTTFCCKFASFPEGSQEACGSLLLSHEQGHPTPTSASLLRADLAGILGVSGILLFGCVYLLHLLHRQRLWSVPELQPPGSSPQMQVSRGAEGYQATSPASLSSLNTAYATVTNNYHCPGPQASWALISHSPCQHPRATLLGSVHSSFVSVENRLYVQAGEGLGLGPPPPRALEERGM
ncbi:transmembrane protein PVRIG isoform X1 [Erinaceus europaeus]|uniref:Transmembrane protein PVRIG isoform X1 n=1 Tax=Erinaceus europaeus TaxID=9365 RepID=A0ABM3VVC8_ERIEU|nr:transmembrane protein PVRIG isoform X1 [Erinaceus europaeus]